MKVCVGEPDDGESGSDSDDDEKHGKNNGDSGTDAVWQTGIYVSGERYKTLACDCPVMGWMVTTLGEKGKAPGAM
eukprot:8123129-Alexandrium_andersonii.AAC.1